MGRACASHGRAAGKRLWNPPGRPMGRGSPRASTRLRSPGAYVDPQTGESTVQPDGPELSRPRSARPVDGTSRPVVRPHTMRGLGAARHRGNLCDAGRARAPGTTGRPRGVRSARAWRIARCMRPPADHADPDRAEDAVQDALVEALAGHPWPAGPGPAGRVAASAARSFLLSGGKARPAPADRRDSRWPSTMTRPSRTASVDRPA